MAKRKEYFINRQETFKRSEVQIAPYNPRRITKQAKTMLKRSMDKFGVVGGIVVNRRTMTIVSGNQKIAILDKIYKFPENDYDILADSVDCDYKTELEMNTMLDSEHTKGEYDIEKMREIIPDMDWQEAGLTEEDLTAFGIDIFAQTEEEKKFGRELDEMFSDMNNTQEVRRQIEQNQVIANQEQEERCVKEHTKPMADKTKMAEKAVEAEVYVMLSFDSDKAKEQFLTTYGFNKAEKVISGETLMEAVKTTGT